MQFLHFCSYVRRLTMEHTEYTEKEFREFRVCREFRV